MLRFLVARVLWLCPVVVFLWGSTTQGRGLFWPSDRLLPSFPRPAKTIDCIDVTSASAAELDLFSSLEGIVNRTQPSLALVSDATQEGKFTWLKIHELDYVMLDGYQAIAKHQKSLSGLVITDPDQPATLNLATTIAGLNNELICAPALLARLTNAPYHLVVRDDLRGRFTSASQVYQEIFDNYWPHCTHRLIAGMNPGIHANLRDYLVAAQVAAVWLAPGENSDDAQLLGKFIANMQPAHGVYLGWWPSEDDGLGWIGQYGIQVLASDFFNNGSLYSGVGQTQPIPAIPPRPPLENKIYLSFIISDGDNVQYMQHKLNQAWTDPGRGSVPIGWTVSPLAVDLDPGMLAYYWRTATTNDCLISGPSGAGYARLNYWSRPADLAAFAKVTDPYLRRSGLRVITVWNKITPAAADDFAAACPTLLGLTDQSGGGYSAMHSGLPVLGLAAHGQYDGNVDQLVRSINRSAHSWSPAAPKFVAVQGVGWSISATDCRKIADSLDKTKFMVVRPDHLFMLIKEQAAKAKRKK